MIKVTRPMGKKGPCLPVSIHPRPHNFRNGFVPDRPCRGVSAGIADTPWTLVT